MLEVKGLGVAYGRVVAVREASFSVPTGKTIALLGANGAGKTTTLLTIAGALSGFKGDILFEGRSIRHISPAERVHLGIALVPEGRHLFPQLTVSQNLRLGYAAGRRHQRSFSSTLDWLLDLFPRLWERRNMAAGSLSGGEQQMLAIARALASEPRLLMVDELSLGLGPMVVEQLFAVLERLVHEEGLTVLLVEQYVEHALRLADYGYILQKGSILAQGTGEQLLEEGVLTTSYLGDSLTSRQRVAGDDGKEMTDSDEAGLH